MYVQIGLFAKSEISVQKTKAVQANESDEQKREWLLARRRKTESFISTGNTLGRSQGASSMISTPSLQVLRLIVMVRRQIIGRAMHATRTTSELAEHVKKSTAGPLYLIVQIAMEKICDQLANQTDIQMIKAEDLN